MDAQLQRCNVCKNVNTEEATDWVRIGGAANSRQVRPVPMDFCPDCAAKTTVKDTPALMPASPQPLGPRGLSKPLAVSGQPIPAPPAQPPET